MREGESEKVTYEDQVSSIVVKWKTINHIHHPQLLPFWPFGLLVNEADGQAAVPQVSETRPRCSSHVIFAQGHVLGWHRTGDLSLQPIP